MQYSIALKKSNRLNLLLFLFAKILVKKTGKKNSANTTFLFSSNPRNAGDKLLVALRIMQALTTTSKHSQPP